MPFAVDFKGAFSRRDVRELPFNLGSDDGSYLFIGSTLAGAMHADQAFTRSDFTTYLTAGVHDFEVQYYNSLASEAGIEELRRRGVSYVPTVPEPATWGMMILGLGAIGATMRRRRKENVSVAYA